VNKSTLD